MQTEKKPDERPILIDLFNKKFMGETGEKNPFPFPNCMKAMGYFKYVDEETGEEFKEYPDSDTWQKELDGFFRDEFARDNRKFHFTYFIKQFGSFAKRSRVVVKREAVSPWDTCEHCGTDYLRGGKCPKCA
jgi:hypothetical protein